ncbi:MAG: hypothetical protein ACP5GU_05010 [Thermoprotei archaeon]
MKNKLKNLIISILIILILTLSIGLVIYALPKPFNGIVIKFENVPTNAKVEVQIEAFLPSEDPEKPPLRKTILITYINNNELRIPASDIKDILQGIINYEQKYKSIPHIAAANSLIINAWLIDENDNVIDTITDALPYDAQKLLNGGQEQKTFKFHPQKTQTSISKQPSEASCGPTFYWEAQQTWTATHQKVPTLIIYNDYPSLSATIGGSTGISIDHVSGFRLGFAIKLPDSVSFSSPQIGDFASKTSSSYSSLIIVGPGQTGWSWIEGQINGGYYKEVKYCTLTGAKTYTGKEKVDVYLLPYFSGSYIVGGYEVRNDTDGSYYRSLLQYYDTTETGPLQISNTPLDNEQLDVGESILFKDVASYYAFSGIGIGVSAGKILALALGLSTTNTIVMVLSMLAITIQYVDYN